MTLFWNKNPLTAEAARRLRAASRKAPPVDEHTFNYHDLKELWIAGQYAVLTHDGDPAWQCWHSPPTGGAQLLSHHDSRVEAEQAAETHDALVVPPTSNGPGRYVVASGLGDRVIRVRCQSSDPSAVRAIFENLGYETSVEQIA
jgi:hypothetical protein